MSQPDLIEDSAPIVEETAAPLSEAPAPVPHDVPTQKQKTNVYTMMLIISFICLVTACVMLYRELTLWGSYPWWETKEGKPNPQSYYRAPRDFPGPRQLLA